MNQITNGLAIFAKAYDNDPDDTTTMCNYVECLFFANELEKADNLIEQNKRIFSDKYDGFLLEYFEILKIYNTSDLEKLKEIAKGYVQYENMKEKNEKLVGWNLKDAQLFAHFQKDGDLKTALQNIIWYWNEKIDGKRLLNELGIPLPAKPNDGPENT